MLAKMKKWLARNEHAIESERWRRNAFVVSILHRKFSIEFFESFKIKQKNVNKNKKKTKNSTNRNFECRKCNCICSAHVVCRTLSSSLLLCCHRLGKAFSPFVLYSHLEFRVIKRRSCKPDIVTPVCIAGRRWNYFSVTKRQCFNCALAHTAYTHGKLTSFRILFLVFHRRFSNLDTKSFSSRARTLAFICDDKTVRERERKLNFLSLSHCRLDSFDSSKTYRKSIFGLTWEISIFETSTPFRTTEKKFQSPNECEWSEKCNTLALFLCTFRINWFELSLVLRISHCLF